MENPTVFLMDDLGVPQIFGNTNLKKNTWKIKDPVTQKSLNWGNNHL